jgi:hypothetical protein
VDMHATDLVAINGITGVLSVYSCQQGVCPRGHVLPLRLPYIPRDVEKEMLGESVATYCENQSRTLKQIGL